mgnify:CR=1 FL=1
MSISYFGTGQDLLRLEEEGNYRDFEYDACFPETTSQAEIFDTCVLPVVDKVFAGYNGSVLAYGQTGTGKTFTMGLLESSQDLLPSSDPSDHSTVADRVRRKGVIPQSLYEVCISSVRIHQ